MNGKVYTLSIEKGSSLPARESDRILFQCFNYVIYHSYIYKYDSSLDLLLYSFSTSWYTRYSLDATIFFVQAG